MEADFVGLNKIVDVIKSSGFVKCSIYRYPNSTGSLPVFQKLNTKNNHELCTQFIDWGKHIDNNVVYEVTLFNNVDTVVDETGQEKVSKTKSKDDKAKFLVQFKKEASITATGGNDINTIVGLVADKINKANEENILMNEIKSIKDKLSQLESEDEDEDESDLGALNPNNLNMLMSAIQMLNPNKPNNTTVINGLSDDKKSNIQKALKVLYKHDPDLDTDLLKLSDLAENNNATFKMLLTTLRNM
jgi:hypothetical protein